MKKRLCFVLSTILCLSALGLVGCTSTAQKSPDVTIEQGCPDVTIDENFVTGTPDTRAFTSEDPAIGAYLGITVLEIREDGLFRVVVRDSFMEIKDDHLEGVQFWLRVKNEVDPCVGDWLGFKYKGASGEIIDGLPVCETQEARIVSKESTTDKPIIYFYPETPTEVSVKLTLDGDLTCTYPDYEKGWQGFTAHPDGTLIFPDGKEYYCLYWEGIQDTAWDFSTGFCVKGSDTTEFLEWALAEQGLTPREANEFIIYWLPLMQNNPYNVISFQTDAYTDTAVLDITPKPDSLIRICMAWYATETAVEMEPQAFDIPVRDGFTVVEWGGSQVKAP